MQNDVQSDFKIACRITYQKAVHSIFWKHTNSKILQLPSYWTWNFSRELKSLWFSQTPTRLPASESPTVLIEMHTPRQSFQIIISGD